MELSSSIISNDDSDGSQKLCTVIMNIHSTHDPILINNPLCSNELTYRHKHHF